MSVTAERLQGALDERGWDQTDLAKRVGATQGAISKILVGKTTNSRLMPRIASVLGKSLPWLLGETDDPSVNSIAPVANDVAAADTVEIDALDLSYGLGGSFLDTDHVEAERIVFSRSWLRRFTQSSPDMLFSTQGIGDSMMPSIHDRDIVIVDRSQNRIEGNVGDKFWAIVFGGVGMIKRLRPMPDGTVKIMSDNQLVRDEVATDGDLFIVGRVVAIVKSA